METLKCAHMQLCIGIRETAKWVKVQVKNGCVLSCVCDEYEPRFYFMQVAIEMKTIPEAIRKV